MAGEREDLRQFILSSLGSPAVAVELDPPQLDIAIDNAMRKLNQFLCRPDPRISQNRTGSVQITLESGDRGVIACKLLFPEDSRVYAQMNIFEIMYRMVFPRLPLGEWYTLKTFYEMYQRVRGTDPDWYFDESTKTLCVDAWSGPYDVFYIVATDLTVESLSQYRTGYFRYLQEYALAEAKLILARVRGKFAGTIPVPGGMMGTDAAELKAEGEAKKAEIEAILEKVGRFSVTPIMWG